MKQILLADRYDTNDLIKEMRIDWVRTMLLMLEVDEDDLEINEQDILFKYNIEVWDHLDNGDVEIIKDNILVAKWYAPIFIPKFDEKNNIYYEIQLEYDSIFDES